MDSATPTRLREKEKKKEKEKGEEKMGREVQNARALSPTFE
jgi:hypothetical protein